MTVTLIYVFIALTGPVGELQSTASSRGGYNHLGARPLISCSETELLAHIARGTEKQNNVKQLSVLCVFSFEVACDYDCSLTGTRTHQFNGIGDRGCYSARSTARNNLRLHVNLVPLSSHPGLNGRVHADAQAAVHKTSCHGWRNPFEQSREPCSRIRSGETHRATNLKQF